MQNFAFLSVAIEELQPFQTRGVQVVVDILRQVRPHSRFAQTHAWRPFLSNLAQAARSQPVVAGLLKNGGKIEPRGRVFQ